MDENKNELLELSFKANILLMLVDAGVIEPHPDGSVPTDAYQRFYNAFTEYLVNSGNKRNDSSEVLGNDTKREPESRAEKRRNYCHAILASISAFCIVTICYAFFTAHGLGSLFFSLALSAFSFILGKLF